MSRRESRIGQLSRAVLGIVAAFALYPAEVRAQQPSQSNEAQALDVRGYMADSSLAVLEPMIGAWRPLGLPDSLARLDPPIVGHRYDWTVGGRAIRIREGYRGDPDTAELDGLVYWNPATERIEFVAVAGHGPGQGRFFQGEYRQLEDGSIERIYDVFYRSLADMPGEEFGGSRRRYREVYTPVTADSVTFTLDWFHDGAWRDFGRFATGGFTRIVPSEGSGRN